MITKSGLLLFVLAASAASGAEWNPAEPFSGGAGVGGYAQDDASGYAPFIGSYSDPYASDASMDRSARSSLNYDDEAPLGGISSHQTSALGASGVSSVAGDSISRYDNFGPSSSYGVATGFPSGYGAGFPGAGGYSLPPSAYPGGAGYVPTGYPGGSPYEAASYAPLGFLKKHHLRKYLRGLKKAHKYAPVPLGAPYDPYASGYGPYGDYYPTIFQVGKYAIKSVFKAIFKGLFSWWPFQYHHAYDGVPGGYYAWASHPPSTPPSIPPSIPHVELYTRTWQQPDGWIRLIVAPRPITDRYAMTVAWVLIGWFAGTSAAGFNRSVD